MRVRASACVAAALVAIGSPASADFERAWQNYYAIVNGTRQLAQLSPAEVQELRELDRHIRDRQTDKRTPRQKCIDEEIDDLGQEPSDLALRIIDLKCSQR